MRGKKTAWLAWILFGLIAVLVLWDMAQTISDHTEYDNIFALLDPLFWSFIGIVFAFVGALIVSRQPRNIVGWLILLPALAMAFEIAMFNYASRLETIPAEPSPLFLVAAWLVNIAWLFLIFPVLFILQLFPLGRPLTPRWRWLIAMGVGMCAFFAGWTLFETKFGLGEYGTISNPIGFISSESFPMSIWIINLVLFVLGSAVSLILRIRRGDQIERKRIKWLLYACGLFVTLYISWILVMDLSSLLSDILIVLIPLSLMTIPAAIAIAVLRYQLYDIDVIIRKTLLYGGLTGLLAIVYLGGIVIFQALFESITGQQSPVAIVISTLLIAALFTPIRRRLQQAIDRRFFRQKYDAQLVLTQFAQTARDEVDLESLTDELARVTSETVQPESITIWLRDRRS